MRSGVVAGSDTREQKAFYIFCHKLLDRGPCLSVLLYKQPAHADADADGNGMRCVVDRSNVS